MRLKIGDYSLTCSVAETASDLFACGDALYKPALRAPEVWATMLRERGADAEQERSIARVMGGGEGVHRRLF